MVVKHNGPAFTVEVQKPENILSLSGVLRRAGCRGTWAKDGGGALMNKGVHGVDMIQWLAGGVVSVFGKERARSIEVVAVVK